MGVIVFIEEASDDILRRALLVSFLRRVLHANHVPVAVIGVGSERAFARVEQAAIEQVAYWFRNRDKSGLIRSWPYHGTFEAFAQLDLLLEVRAVLKKYERFLL